MACTRSGGPRERGHGLAKVALALALVASIAPRAAAGARSTLQAPNSIPDTDGRPHPLVATGKVRVLVFLSPECPLSRRYVPTLNRLAGANAAAGVELLGIVSDASATRAGVAGFKRSFEIAFPVLFDAGGDAAAWLRPTRVPEAFVLDPAGAVAYRGRIDDAYAAVGAPNAAVAHNDLQDAVAALLQRRPVAVRATKAIGCVFEPPPRGPRGLPRQVTFNRHVAPIVHARCAPCHHEGEVAPFPLVTYEHAAKRAQMIREVVEARQMPPWKAAPGYGHFQDERRLTDGEIALVGRWALAGAPAGAPEDRPVPPTFAPGWQLGAPDLVVKMPEPYEVPAEGPDVLRNFVIPLDLPADVMVTAVQFRPGTPAVVHHALAFLDSNGVARRLDAADPGPGYTSFGGPGFFPTGSLGGWAPGAVPRFLRDGMGRVLKRGSDLVLQIHYHPSGRAERDASTLGIYFARTPATKPIGGIALENWDIEIPAGAVHYERRASYLLPVDTTIVSVTPHMHKLGKSMRVRAVRPNGAVEPLVLIRDWDFDWQDTYVLAAPLRLPKGTRLEMVATYDNSAGNRRNPSRPPRAVRWGEQSTDEMALCVFEVTADSIGELLTLIGDDMRHRLLIERAMLLERQRRL